MFAAGNTQPKVKKAKCAGICAHESLPQLQMLSEWIKHSRKCHVQHEASSLHELMGFLPGSEQGHRTIQTFVLHPGEFGFITLQEIVHQTHLEMSQCSVPLCPDFPWAEHAQPSHFHCAKQTRFVVPCCWHQEIINVTEGSKRGGFNPHTFA